MIKDKNGKDLREAEEIRKRWQEYSELCKIFLITWITRMLQSLSQSQTSWSVMSSGPQKNHYEQSQWSYGIPTELFQILKDDAIKVLHSICQQKWRTQQWPQDWKRSVFIPIPKKGNAKVYLNYCTVALISHARKVMLKILQARLQLYINQEL